MPHQPDFTRRDFLKLGGLSLGALAARPFFPAPQPISAGDPGQRAMRGRVSRRYVYAYSQPDYNSTRLYRIYRDTLLELFDEVVSPYGPEHNPLWYRSDSNFVHSAYIQRVEDAHVNIPLTSMPAGGMLGEITVPYSQTVYKKRFGDWTLLYRLYYGSMHWVTDVIEVPKSETLAKLTDSTIMFPAVQDLPGLRSSPFLRVPKSPGSQTILWSPGQPLYVLTDIRPRLQYCVPASHVRLLGPQEFEPISQHVPAEEKRVEVSLADQMLTAYEGNQVVLTCPVTTGGPATVTPKGSFYIGHKMPSRHMGDGKITSNPNAYELVGVPWVCYFIPSGIAFHGTYWHDDFGMPGSHGCVNMPTDAAHWLFRWCDPVYNPQIHNLNEWRAKARGTRVIVH